MKSTIQKIFGDPSATTCDIAPAIKVEPAFVSEHQSRGRFSNRSTWRGRGRGRGTFRGNTNTNPLDREGNILRCFKCGSDKHFARQCKADSHYEGMQSSKPEKINITLNVSQIPLNALLSETLGMGVLDTGCTKTVAGEEWMEAYLDTLSKEDRDLVKTFKTNSSFCFGDGVSVNASRCVKFPAVIGNKKIYIQANVVENQIHF